METPTLETRANLIETEIHELRALGTGERRGSLRGRNRQLVNGNGAVAWAAAAAGVSYFSHYPGSPVAQVEPILKRISADFELGIRFNDALNEHIATLAAAGASYCGARSLVVMKHVGLNIAADPVNYLGLTGVKGGLVIVIGTDPGANSSTGEEDVHWYVPQVNFPLFEPTSVPDIYRFTQEAFECSERYSVPAFLFLPTRIAGNSDLLELPALAPRPPARFSFERNPDLYVNVGQSAVRNHRLHLERMERLAREKSFAREFYAPEARVGLLSRGATFGHAFEAVRKLGLENEVHLLNLDLVYPLPRELLLRFAAGKERLLVIEDQDGFLENQLKMELFNELDCEVQGKSLFPRYGEVDFARVHSVLAGYFGLEAPPTPAAVAVPERLGAFCEGCPHRSSFWAIDEAIKGTRHIIGGDIGCSSLPPQRADWLLCMNAGIGVSQGMSHILDPAEQVVVSTGGEGSFFHGGLVSLQSAVLNKIDLLHVVFDNRSVAMTGHQDSPTSGDQVNVRQLLESIGVQRIFELNAFDPLSLRNRLKAELQTKGVRVLWVRGDCALQPDQETLERRRKKSIRILNEKCGSCNACYQDLACPAIERPVPTQRNLLVNLDRCMRCGVCAEICPNEAIEATFAP